MGDVDRREPRNTLDIGMEEMKGVHPLCHLQSYVKIYETPGGQHRFCKAKDVDAKIRIHKVCQYSI